MKPIARCLPAAASGAAVLLLLVSCGGGGGGGEKPSGVTQVVGAAGGNVAHPSGVSIEVPAGVLAGNASMSITPVALPNALPGGIASRSQPYELGCGGATMDGPVAVRFPLGAADLQLPAGSLGLYRWDGTEWLNAGGVIEGGALRTSTKGFSIFVIGTGRSLHKPLDFYNTGSFDANVSVHRYSLAHPDLDAPISPAFSFPVFAADLPERRAVFPQGSYSFCAEWWKPLADTTAGPRWLHKIVGNSPPPAGNWTYWLNENSNDLVPETVWFDTGIPYLEGRCAAVENVGSGGGPPVTLSGTWVLSVRCVGATTTALSITFQIAQSGGAFSGNGTGTDYDGTPLTAVIQGGYSAGTNIIAGTVSFSAGGKLFRTDSFSTTLVGDTGYVPFTITSNTGEEGCTAEGRFVKQAP